MEKTNYKPGFAGHDAMREKAKRIFDGEMHSITMEKPMSASAPSKTPMRMYKKGGSVRAMPHANDLCLKKGGKVKHMNEGGSAYEQQSARYTHPAKSKGPFHDREDNDLHLKKGGSAKKTSVLRQAMKGRTKKKESMAKMDADMDKAQKPMKKGGKAGCYNMGGMAKMAAGGVAKIRHGVATKSGMPIDKMKVKRK